MGHGAGVCVPQFVAHHLLELTVPYLADNAPDAVLPQGW